MKISNRSPGWRLSPRIPFCLLWFRNSVHDHLLLGSDCCFLKPELRGKQNRPLPLFFSSQVQSRIYVTCLATSGIWLGTPYLTQPWIISCGNSDPKWLRNLPKITGAWLKFRFPKSVLLPVYRPLDWIKSWETSRVVRNHGCLQICQNWLSFSRPSLNTHQTLRHIWAALDLVNEQMNDSVFKLELKLGKIKIHLKAAFH